MSEDYRPLILVAEDDDSNFKLIKAIIGKNFACLSGDTDDYGGRSLRIKDEGSGGKVSVGFRTSGNRYCGLSDLV